MAVEDRNLGFGSAMAQNGAGRLLERDGSFNARRVGLPFAASHSLYQTLLDISWAGFLGLVIALYLIINLLFAVCYLLCGPDSLAGALPVEEGYFLRAFFFSVQTFSTIGYGHVSPVGLVPNILVTVEALSGLMVFTLITGLLFARFSRPRARILFSEKAIIAPYRGGRAFEFRIANALTNQLIEVETKVILSRIEREGERDVRRFHTLDLEISKVTFFSLCWTVVHPIVEGSPLWGTSEQELHASEAEFLILLTGIDESFSQTVHARSSYAADEIVWNVKFTNIFLPRTAAAPIGVDVARISEIEAVS